MIPSFFSPILEAPARPPKLFVVVDTEEEFDWSAPFSRDNVGVTAIADAYRLQRVVAPYRLTPTYVVDYPVASTPSSAATLAEFAAKGECRIGAHLHPWVTPPFDEPLVPGMSFGCNLGQGLEGAKITALAEAIGRNMSVTPRVYKAGRYGFGETTAEILETLDFQVDASVIPHMDFTSEQGPSFAGFSPAPGRFGRAKALLELPCTTGFTGALRGAGAPVHRAASAAWLTPARAVGILARTGLLNKVMLSPEGNTLDEMKALTRALHADGLRTFAMTLHSPSLKPGCTRYARTTGERDAFLTTIDRYCDFFFTELGGTPTTAEDLYKELIGEGSEGREGG
jgi:hypothetical protein